MTTVSNVRIGLRRDGALVESERPRLQWMIETDAPGWLQGSAEIELSRNGTSTVFAHESADSVAVPWPFDELLPRESGAIRIRVTGVDGSTSSWSERLEFGTGFLGAGEWAATFLVLPEPSRPAQPVLFRTEFDVDRPVASATLYASAQGVYQAELNGQEVDAAVLKPGWTPYAARLGLEATDVTALVRTGPNALGLHLAGGWYTLQDYGEQPSVAAQLVLKFEDGEERTLVTDATWLASGTGPVVETSIYDGETYDQRLVAAGWSEPGFDDSAWVGAGVRPVDIVPAPSTMPQTRRTAELAVQKVIHSDGGKLILDFGQNLVGWVRLDLTGPAGSEVRLRHGEVLQVLDDPEVFDRILLGAKVTDRVTLAGGRLLWEPKFTFHGFRYVEIEGWPGEFDPQNVTAIVVNSELERTGWFESSNELLNRFHENAVWSMRGNFLALPTDCPQRAERRGWTGDLQMFAPTASFLYDCEGFLRSWLLDLALEQDAHGYVPVFVPAHATSTGGAQPGPAAAWSDAATIVPAVLYERFGDPVVLADQFESMREHVDLLADDAGADHIWSGGFQFGDWLDPTAPPDAPFAAKTDPDLLATAFFFRSATLLADAAEVLGELDAARRARTLAEEVRAAWLRRFTTAEARTMSDSQTSYALALVFGIELDPDRRRLMGARLAALVREGGYTIGTGLVGTPYALPALSSTGELGAAARLLLQTRCPSWLFPVTMGATTVWERWDSLRPDGSVNPSRMVSFNHYALGAVADWLHTTVAGLAPSEPGYREITVAPHPIPGLDHAHAALVTPYGRAEVGWSVVDVGGIEVVASIPPNTTGVVRLPGHLEVRVGSGQHRWRIHDARDELPAEFGLDTRIRAFLDDPANASRVRAALGGEDPEAMMGAMLPGTSVRQTFRLENPDVRARLEAEFHDLA